MCDTCWELVPIDLQREVYRTVKLRGPVVDKTWSPWWRAQARAIHSLCRNDMLLTRELAFADELEKR